MEKTKKVNMRKYLPAFLVTLLASAGFCDTTGSISINLTIISDMIEWGLKVGSKGFELSYTIVAELVDTYGSTLASVLVIGLLIEAVSRLLFKTSAFGKGYDWVKSKMR